MKSFSPQQESGGTLFFLGKTPTTQLQLRRRILNRHFGKKAVNPTDERGKMTLKMLKILQGVLVLFGLRMTEGFTSNIGSIQKINVHTQKCQAARSLFTFRLFSSDSEGKKLKNHANNINKIKCA